jgi:predicted nucleic acid-binding protein
VTAFLDTNIFVYQFDNTQTKKRECARKLVRDALADGSGICSSQVVNEFCNLALRRFAVPFSAAQCADYFQGVLQPLCTVGWNPQLVTDALNVRERYQISWYDALVVAAATQGGAETLFTEDLQHAMRFGAVKVVNPFK